MSSAVDKLIVAAAPHITLDHPMRDHFEKILSYVGQISMLSNSNESNTMSVDDFSVVEISDEMVDEVMNSDVNSNSDEDEMTSSGSGERKAATTKTTLSILSWDNAWRSQLIMHVGDTFATTNFLVLQRRVLISKVCTVLVW